MNYKDLLKDKECHISFENICEPRTKEVKLRIIVNVSKDTSDLIIHPHPDSNVTTLQLDFANYITYSVTYDDYTMWYDDEIFEGNAFRIYTHSHYLDFIQKEYKLEEMLNGKKITHYALACFDHVVDVISYVEPMITAVKHIQTNN